MLVIDGKTIEDNTFKELRNSSAKAPADLTGKLLLGKVFQGFWYQCSQKVTIVNIWSSALGQTEMAEITTSIGCARKGDLLAWENMNWKLEGVARLGEVAKEEVCHEESKILVLLWQT